MDSKYEELETIVGSDNDRYIYLQQKKGTELRTITFFLLKGVGVLIEDKIEKPNQVHFTTELLTGYTVDSSVPNNVQLKKI